MGGAPGGLTHLQVDVLCPDNVEFTQSGVSLSAFVSFQRF